jgi:hypothetical protein
VLTGYKGEKKKSKVVYENEISDSWKKSIYYRDNPSEVEGYIN